MEPAPGGPGASPGGLRMIPLDEITPNRFQPRQEFDEAGLRSLADSIRSAGVMQPIAVRPATNGANTPAGVKWELVAGERRWRAARLAGLASAPAVVTRLSDREAAEWSVVENLQRADLNPMERAFAFRKLNESFGLSHEEIAQRVGLGRPTVANLVRLTDLEPPIRDRIARGELTPGHGKALLAIAAGAARLAAADSAASGGWTVRRLEQFSTSPGAPGGGAPSDGANARRDAARRDIEKRIGERLGTRVRIRTRADGKRGNIALDFYNLDHFEDLLRRLGVAGE